MARLSGILLLNAVLLLLPFGTAKAQHAQGADQKPTKSNDTEMHGHCLPFELEGISQRTPFHLFDSAVTGVTFLSPTELIAADKTGKIIRCDLDSQTSTVIAEVGKADPDLGGWVLHAQSTSDFLAFSSRIDDEGSSRTKIICLDRNGNRKWSLGGLVSSGWCFDGENYLAFDKDRNDHPELWSLTPDGNLSLVRKYDENGSGLYWLIPADGHFSGQVEWGLWCRRNPMATPICAYGTISGRAG